MSERPSGWRPYTEEQRQLLLKTFTEERIDEMEADNIYTPIPAAIMGVELAAAIADVLAARLGPEFATALHDRLEHRADALEAEGGEAVVELPIVRDILKWPAWKRWGVA